MSYSETDRTDMENFLRDSMGEEVPIMNAGILTKALVISEWLTPDGKRYLARTPVGELTQWDIQGFCVSTMDASDWQDPDE
jgi:hypothetical protein